MQWKSDERTQYTPPEEEAKVDQERKLRRYFDKTNEQLQQRRGWEVATDETGRRLETEIQPFLSPRLRSQLYYTETVYSKRDPRTGEEKRIRVPMVMKIVDKTYQYQREQLPERHFQFQQELMRTTNREGSGLFTDFLAAFDDGDDHVMVTPHYPYELEGLMGGEWLRSWGNIFHTCSAMTRGMEFLHKKGLIHGDFKPDQCLITQNGTIKIGDLETVRRGDDTEVNGILTDVNTPAYADSKVLNKEKLADQQSDMVSLAASIYRVITNGHLFFYRAADAKPGDKPSMPNLLKIAYTRQTNPYSYYPLLNHFYPDIVLNRETFASLTSAPSLLYDLDFLLQRALGVNDPPYENVTEFRVELEKILNALYYSIEAQELLAPKSIPIKSEVERANAVTNNQSSAEVAASQASAEVTGDVAQSAAETTAVQTTAKKDKPVASQRIANIRKAINALLRI